MNKNLLLFIIMYWKILGIIYNGFTTDTLTVLTDAFDLQLLHSFNVHQIGS